jgi:hypothetical protein
MRTKAKSLDHKEVKIATIAGMFHQWLRTTVNLMKYSAKVTTKMKYLIIHPQPYQVQEARLL